MLEKINALMESEETKNLISENEELITEAIGEATEFSKVLKVFALEHPEEFLGENTEETYKNVRLFSEVATAQFMTEVTNVYGSVISEQQTQTIQESGIDDYL